MTACMNIFWLKLFMIFDRLYLSNGKPEQTQIFAKSEPNMYIFYATSYKYIGSCQNTFLTWFLGATASECVPHLWLLSRFQVRLAAYIFLSKRSIT